MSMLGAMYPLSRCRFETAGQPSVSTRISDRHASTQRSSNVDVGRYRYQRSNEGYAGVRSSHSSCDSHDSDRSSKFDQNG